MVKLAVEAVLLVPAMTQFPGVQVTLALAAGAAKTDPASPAIIKTDFRTHISLSAWQYRRVAANQPSECLLGFC
jgi:hypothetical protein